MLIPPCVWQQPETISLEHGLLMMIYCCWKRQLTFSSKVPDLNQNWSSRQIFVQVPDAKFHGNPSSGSRADISGQTDKRREGRTAMIKLIWDFRDCQNARNKTDFLSVCLPNSLSINQSISLSLFIYLCIYSFIHIYIYIIPWTLNCF